MFVDEAMKKLAERDYALVLVNRLVFADGSEGSRLITRMKSDAAIAKMPVMLVSNYADAQQAAVAAGAVPGFGKAAVYDDGTLDRLAKFLPRKST